MKQTNKKGKKNKTQETKEANVILTFHLVTKTKKNNTCSIKQEENKIQKCIKKGKTKAPKHPQEIHKPIERYIDIHI